MDRVTVQVATELLDEWSEPLQVKVTRNAFGGWELIFRRPQALALPHGV